VTILMFKPWLQIDWYCLLLRLHA